MKDNKIVLGKGLGTLVFGAIANDVETILGKADEIEVSEDEDEAVAELWHYDELDMSVGFDDDGRVITISVTSNDYTLEGQGFIGLSKTELLEGLKKIKITDTEEDECDVEDEATYTVISSESNSLSCWLENDIVTELQWDVLLDGDGYIQWA